MAYGLATVFHGSGLIAAFTAGLAFGTIATAEEEEAAEMIETIGDGFSATTFLVFGAAIVPLMLEAVTWGSLLFVVLALTVARMLPVALALLGTKARLPTVAFVGWFGPRGLASIVFAVLILQAEPIPSLGIVLATISLTVVVSVYAHGVTALPLTERFVVWMRANPRAEAARADGRGVTVQAGGIRGWVNGIRPEKGTIRDEAIAGLPGAIGYRTRASRRCRSSCCACGGTRPSAQPP